MVFTLLYGVYLNVPAIVNLTEKTSLIEQTVLKETGYKISLKNPNLNMGIVPSVILSTDNFKILNDDNTEALNADNIKFKIKLFPLIFKNIEIKDFYAGKIDVNLVYDKELKLGQYSLENAPQSDFKLNKINLQVDDYNIYFDDKTQNKKTVFDGGQLTISEFKNNKHIALATTAGISSDNKNSKFELNLNSALPFDKISKGNFELSGNINNLDLGDFSSLVKSISKNEIKYLSGIINADAITVKSSDKQKIIKINSNVKNLGIYKEQLSESIYFKDELTLTSELLTVKNGVKINDLRIKGNGINAFSHGKITNLSSRLPNLDLKIGINNSKAEKFVCLLPPVHDLSPDMDFYLIKKAGFWGDVWANLEVKGKADFPKVFGKVFIKNAYMVREIPNAKKANILLDFVGDKFNLDVTVPTSPTQTVWVKGPIDIIQKDHPADLHITSTENVDLKTAQIVLNPLHKILHFELGPVPIMDIRGQGGINLRVTGTQQNPHAWGEFWFNDAVVSFLDIHNMEIHNGSGVLKFNNQNTWFESKTATLNGKPVSIKGSCNLYGVLNFDVISSYQDLGKLFNAVQTSPMLKDIRELIKPIEAVSGLANVKINLHGQVQDPNDIVFNKNFFAKGSLELLSNEIKINGMKIANIKGLIGFNNADADLALKSNIYNSIVSINGKIKNNVCNLKVVSNKFNIGDGLKMLSLKLPYEKDLSTINTSFFLKYIGKIDDIEYNKIYTKGKIYPNKGAKSAVIVNGSDFLLENSNFRLSPLRGTFNGKPYNLSINASDIFGKFPLIDGYGKFNDFDLSVINNPNIQKLLPNDLLEQLKDFEIINGTTDISLRAKNSNYNVYTVLDNIVVLYKPTDTKIILKNGNVLLQNSTLNLNKITAQIGQMPVFANGKIHNIYKNPNLNMYLNLKLAQDFFDQFFNQKSIYPIKVKGDVIVSSKITGGLNNINAKSTLDVKEDSSLYYMGAIIGDIQNPVKITIDKTYSRNKIMLHDLQYDKIIMSQNNKPFANTQLNASGMLTLLPDGNVGFNNFKIKTKNPTDAKIFNIIFRKPFMKQGVFNSDLIMNGTSINPKIIGKLDITSIDIPFFDSTIKDINLDFKPDKVFVSSRGKVADNDVDINAVVKNKFVPPYVIENIQIKMADLNINKIDDTIRDIEAEAARVLNVKTDEPSVPFDISQLIIKNAQVQADKIQVRNIDATNFFAKLKLSEKAIANIEEFKFNIAEGLVWGSVKSNILKNDLKLSINLKDANALIMSEALFDLKGQVYGSVSGNFDLSCDGFADDKCFKTLSGEGKFNVADGKMPKLGSLEYLLKAGNLLRSGITGLSINGLVDLVTPLKTGEFESISGDIHISQGVADKINVYSKGHDLNMYMTGSYNISSSVADMKVLGSLSKNITSVFGKIKNASLNTLFNTIPGVNDSNEKLLLEENISKIPNINNATDIYRIFEAEINGDINGTGYVKSFRWVK